MPTTTTIPTRQRFSGVWLPLITPFRDGALDEASLRKLLRHYAGLPIDGFILAGTTGEFQTAFVVPATTPRAAASPPSRQRCNPISARPLSRPPT